ncbi:MAG: L-threonylcarbamoyladenylate synthase [Acidimicrobiales bacterium]
MTGGGPVSTVVTTDVERAAAALRAGRLVAFPTETVYGLGADASNPAAVRAVFEAKGRPAGHPLIVHVASLEEARRWMAEPDPATERRLIALARRFWPGPLTIVVPRSARVAPEAVGARPTIGLRVPAHPVALALLRAFGGGVAGPSANRFGRVSPTTAAHVLADLEGRVDVLLDGGPTAVGVESTIVDLVGAEPLLLRPGGVSVAELETALDEPVPDGRTGEARASGMLASHYAPRASVALVAAADLASALASARDERGEAGVVGVIAPAGVSHQPSWTLPDEAAGYARQLYAALRAADAAGVDHLLVVAPSHGPLLDAVLDRLTKAAAPRPG